jgi:hypothetical protein
MTRQQTMTYTSGLTMMTAIQTMAMLPIPIPIRMTTLTMKTLLLPTMMM